MIRTALILLYFITVVQVLKSQSLKDTINLKEVFVTSARQITEKGLQMRSIDSIVIGNSSHTGLSDLLLKHSTLYIKSYGAGGLSTATFRGTAASHTQVLWNGLNINSPLWGQTDLSLLPVFFTDEVSLYYGSSSLAKTSGGLGGCINMNNTPSWNAGTQASFSQTAGSFGYFLSQLKLGVSKDRFVSNTRIYRDNSRNNFKYFDNATGRNDYVRQKNASYQKTGFLQEFYYKLTSKQFAGIKAMSMWSDRNLPPIMSYGGSDRYENQKDMHFNLLGEWKYYGAKTSISLNMGYSYATLGYILSNSNPGGIWVNFDTKSVSHVFSNKLNVQHNLSTKAVWKTSAESVITQASYNEKIEQTGFDVDRSDISLQTSFHYVFSGSFSGYALAQQKMVDRKLMPFIAATGIEYKLIKPGTLTFKANIGRNLHVPNLDDLYFTPGGNPDLKPEEGYQSDAGLIWSDGIGNITYQFELTGFASRIDNWILWHPSEYRYWTADNVHKVFSRGAEMNGTVKGNLGSVKYQVRGNYGFTRTTNEDRMSDSYGMQLIYIPKHIGNTHLYLEKGTWSSVLSYHYTGARWTSTSEDNVHLMPYYFFIDLGCGKKINMGKLLIDINFRLNNLLDKQYQVIRQRAMPGRNYTLTLKLSY